MSLNSSVRSGVKIILILVLSAFLNSCGSDDGVVYIPAGGSGTPDAPTQISINTTYPNEAIRGSSPVNYYYFTTGKAGAYEISLTNANADVSWNLFDSMEASSPILVCDNMYYTADEACAVTLDAGTSYYMMVINWAGPSDASVDLRVEGVIVLPGAPDVSAPEPTDGASEAPGASGQVLRVLAPGASGGTFYYDDDTSIDWFIPAIVNGDYLEVTIPYSAGGMADNGTNYWYVNAFNSGGATRYPATGQLSFTVTPSTPVADAGEDESYRTGSSVTLDGSGSSDPNGDSLTYAWFISQKPMGSTSALSDTSASSPFFTADLAGTYAFDLVVSDGILDSAPDTVTITVLDDYNNLPVADAGADQRVYAGAASMVILNGSGSTDLDGDSLSYAWSITQKPAGSEAVLSDTAAMAPTFIADEEGTYMFSLIVNDTFANSASPAYVNVTADPYIDTLDFKVVDAEYSAEMDQLIIVSTAPSNQLHIYNAIAETDVAVDLNLAPTSVSVSPDGLYAAVGHNAWVSYIDLAGGALLNTISTTADVSDIVMAGNGYIYAFPRVDQWEKIRCIEIETGKETLHSGMSIYDETKAKLHPSGSYIYGADNGLSPSDIEKYDISSGTASYLYDSPYHGDYSMCGDLWMSEDGLRIFTRCGNVFTSDSIEASDMLYNGSLSELTRIRSLSHSSATGKVDAIPDGSSDMELQTYDYDFLLHESTQTLPSFVAGGTAYAGHGRFVFNNSSGTMKFVVLQADSASGILYDFGIVTY